MERETTTPPPTDARLVRGVALFSMALGLVLILSAGRFLEAPTFVGTFLWARPEGWGAVFMLTGALLLLEFRRGGGSLVALVLTITYAAFAVSAALGPATGRGVFSATIVYLGFAYFSAVSITACGHPSER
ncbi:hypothetical protein V6S67_07875 [Arthrobacter sp. Soc17.1.1.1]|uniref:hypothetical protein n=1 Tax=Arthrobacter sp. Soc17.1.1.1 TaxID=3121277 RepID=UPI002FE4DFC1